MKNINRLTNLSFLLLLLGSVFTGCVRKDDYYKKDTNETSRKQVVQITGADAGIIDYARDINPLIDTFALIDVRRYPNTEAELNQPLTIKITKETTLIDAYNTANGTSYVELPAAAYTLLSDLNNVTFAAGQAIVEVKIRLDKNQLDLSQKYALAFSITDAGGGVVNTTMKDVIYDIGAKNQYDGVYSVVSGTVQRYSAPGVPTTGDALNGDLTGNPDVFMYTAGVNAVDIDQPSDNGFFWAYPTGSPVAGIDGIEVSIDPSTYLTSITSGLNGTLVNWPGHVNSYNPQTRTFTLAFHWNPTANVREYQVVLKYKGSR